jgi:hypothetical protein
MRILSDERRRHHGTGPGRLYRELARRRGAPSSRPETVQSATGHGITSATPLLTQTVTIEKALHGTPSTVGRRTA